MGMQGLGLNIGMMMLGVLGIVVGLQMTDMVVDQVIKAAGWLSEPTYSNVDHGSAKSLNGLLIMLFYIILIIMSLGMVGAGGYRTYRQFRQ